MHIWKKALTVTLGALLAGTAHAALVTVNRGDTLSMKFRIPSQLPNGARLDWLVGYYVSPFVQPVAGWNTKLYDGDRLLGVHSWVNAANTSTVSASFFSPESPFSPSYLPYTPIVDFSSIRNLTIDGRMETTVGSRFILDTEFEDVPNGTFVRLGVGACTEGGCGASMDTGRVTSISLNDNVVYEPPKEIIAPKLPDNLAAPSSGHLIGTIDPSKEHTVVITHGIQFAEYEDGIVPDWTREMQDAIQDKAPDANVVVWVWEEAFIGDYQPPHGNPSELLKAEAVYIGAKGAIPYAQAQGLQLASALADKGAQGIQLIGHSAGNYVNAYAADSLVDRGMAPDQVTILDRPFGVNYPVLVTDADEAIEVSTFSALLDGVRNVDNYHGELASTGDDLPGAFNWEFQGADHEGVHDAYYDSIFERPDDNPVGFPVGFKRSVAYPQIIPLPEWTPLDPSNPFNSFQIGLNDSLFNSINSTVVDDSTLIMSEGSPAYFWGDLTIPENAAFLTFDMLWSDKGDGDFLSVFFNDALLYSFLGIDFIGNDFLNVGLLPISDFAGQTGQLLFALNSVGDSNANFYIRNLTMGTVASSQVPVPGTVVLIGVGLAGLISFRRRAVKLACKAA